jgi:hypothetical protein
MARTSILTFSLGGRINLPGRVTVDGAGSPAWDGFALTCRESRVSHSVDRRCEEGRNFRDQSVNDGDYAFIVRVAGRLVCEAARLGAHSLRDCTGGRDPGGRIGCCESVSAQLEGSVSGHDGSLIGARFDRARTQTPTQSPFAQRRQTRGAICCDRTRAGHGRLRARYSAAGKLFA